jgi:hypothetical protein
LCSSASFSFSVSSVGGALLSAGCAASSEGGALLSAGDGVLTSTTAGALGSGLAYAEADELIATPIVKLAIAAAAASHWPTRVPIEEVVACIVVSSLWLSQPVVGAFDC